MLGLEFRLFLTDRVLGTWSLLIFLDDDASRAFRVSGDFAYTYAHRYETIDDVPVSI